MHPPTNLKSALTYIIWALLDGFILGSTMTLNYAANCGSNIFFIQSVPELSMPMLVISTVVFSAVLFALFCYKNSLCRWATPLCITVFAVTVNFLSAIPRPYFALVMCGLAAGTAFVIKGRFSRGELKLLKGSRLYIIILAFTVFTVAQVALVGIMRHRCYGSSTFDLGIFAQMYHYMSTDLTQNTTLERNVLLSHFAVHFSPIYYLLLPFYLLFPSVEFLLTAQAAVCFSGVIPLLLLCRHWRYSPAVTLGISVVFLMFPAFSGGMFYDFHENAFLVPLMMWLLWSIERDNVYGMAIFGVLLLCVKEDAGLYVVFMGLYALLNKKVSRVSSIMLLIIGVAGFIGVTSLVEDIGEGIKVSRYSIYLTSGQDSLTDVVKNVIKNPAFFFSKLLSETKLLFLVQMLVPLMFLPVRTRKLADWVLIAPLVLVNLASDYAYQADIGFQYVFGSGALLVFLFAKNMRYGREKTKTAAAAAMAAVIILTGSSTGKYEYINRFTDCYEDIIATDKVLETIPRDAVIFSSTYFTPHLSDCKELYMYPPIYDADESIVPDYVLLDNRSGIVNDYDKLLTYWISEGYEVVNADSYVTVLVR